MTGHHGRVLRVSALIVAGSLVLVACGGSPSPSADALTGTASSGGSFVLSEDDRSASPTVQSPSPTVPTSESTAADPTTTSSAAPVPVSTSSPAPTPAAPAATNGLVTAADQAAAAAAVAAMSVEDRAGTVVMASSADAVGSDLVQRRHLGGVILMGSQGTIDGTSAGTPAQVAAVTAALQAQVPAGQAGAPLLVATDQEYGLVTRMVNGFTDFPGADELGDITDTAAAVAATEAVTTAAGRELRAVGVNVDFAPDADIAPRSGASGVAGRTFGSDPDRVGELVGAAVRGYSAGGVAPTIKHFPGIGRLAADTHVALPQLDSSCEEWNAAEAVPFRDGVAAGAPLVMTGHIRWPAAGASELPTSLSRTVLTDLVHGSGTGGCQGLDFGGVAVSDSFEMAPVVEAYGKNEAPWRGIAAGQDLVLMPVDPDGAVDGIVAAANDGRLPAERLTEAATRVYALRLALGRVPAPSLDVVDSAEHQATAAQARSAG
ncbi:hypothetical protein FDO65_05640 [Nakamurella flava]|uniref:Glycoside hydrolase family 3 N-terminal domain-containing protein n=1 Tax=Nakamurella flava TaxID=2576308 RepID=A0A4U6QLF1_9ACTN|nr:glycoside hydrolase family 3 N-terminal domain-containing protein [Nakamurella flava]TKV61119.1 hypothetical protein FDO65_05640 [Nakamurella flava]